jgi:hypothetical protein
VRWNQSQRIRRAHAASRKSVMPSPPNSSGLQTEDQETKHWPPVALSLPAQRNPLLLLSISLNTQSGNLRAIIAWVHLADMTAFTIVNLLALFMSLAFHVSMDAPTLSTSGCRCAFLRRWTERGTRGKLWGTQRFAQGRPPAPV